MDDFSGLAHFTWDHSGWVTLSLVVLFFALSLVETRFSHDVYQFFFSRPSSCPGSPG